MQILLFTRLFLKPTRYVKLILFGQKTRNFKISLFVKTWLELWKLSLSFIIGMQRLSGNMKYPVFRFLWCTDFLWLISSTELPKVFPHVTHWLCFEKAWVFNSNCCLATKSHSVQLICILIFHEMSRFFSGALKIFSKWKKDRFQIVKCWAVVSFTTKRQLDL